MATTQESICSPKEEAFPAPIAIKGGKGQLYKEKSRKLKSCIQHPSDEVLLKGEILRKCSSGAKTMSRRYYVTPDLFCLRWESTGKLGKLADKLKRNSNSIDIASICRIQTGVTTGKLHILDSKTTLSRGNCFSIILSFGKSIDFICTDRAQYDRWFHGISSLVDRHRISRIKDPEKAFLYQIWIHADLNHDGMLNRIEIEKVTHTLNHAADGMKDLRRMFSEVDIDNDGELDFDEYCTFMAQLRHRPELDTLFNPRANGKPYLTLDEFTSFLSSNGHDENEIKTILNLYTREGAVSKHLFRRYIASPYNSWAMPATQQLYQDMTLPISHYFIASSHNTYLEGDQLQSNSSVNMYISALLRSCRCVEIDCWDGEDGQPLVYHGHTLTTKIKFSDVIHAIKIYAFQSSPYPVILSLENHCSEGQQQIMAASMISTFGDQLYTEEPIDGILPSPEILKEKIILKGKGGILNNILDDTDSDDEDDIIENKTTIKKQKKKQKSTISPILSNICFFKGIHFNGFNKTSTWLSNQMSSFSEGKTKKLLNEHKLTFLEFNRKHISRIYPAGIRIDSSNYNPLLGWGAGAQLVALNYQTSDLPMHVNHGLFQQNGNSGYVLKPPSMLSEIGNYTRTIQSITIQVFSGQQLPKPQGEKKGEIIDPYVILDLVGDGISMQKRTHTIQDNGLNPSWNYTAKFEVGLEPSLHVLVLTVMDKDIDRDDLIGFAALPLTCIREGYRTVPLYAGDGTKTGPYEFASLFCHIALEKLTDDEEKTTG